MMDAQSSQFLDAFSSIERHLRQNVNAENHLPFHQLVERAATRDRAVNRYRAQLRTFGNLRNFIVHEYRHHDPVAVPSPATVERLKKMRDELLPPAKLVSVCRREVATCSPADPIGSASRKMHEGGFSQ